MRRSTTHALMDLAVAGFALAFPRVLGASRQFTNATTALALGKIGCAMLTGIESKNSRRIPTEARQALDLGAGATMAALPLMMKEREDPAVVACAVVGGLLEMGAAAIGSDGVPANRQGTQRPGISGINRGVTTELPAEDQETSVPEALQVTQATTLDSCKVAFGVALPMVVMGPITRRPTMMKLAETVDFAGFGTMTMQRLRDKYGPGPLMIKMPLRHQAVLLHAKDVRRVLDETPDIFATASTEKQAALAHFEPKVSLISHGPQRDQRRRLNEETLEQNSPIHSLAENLLPVVDEEAKVLLRKVKQVGELRWEEFSEAWFNMVRRVVFGNAARGDDRISYLMKKLRSDGNWAFLKPINTNLRDELHQRISGYIERAEPGTLASVIGAKAQSKVQAPENQIPQWLFAFDPAAMATYRGLALLAKHPKYLDQAREESAGQVAEVNPHRPLLRATVLESLRLWPTTPMILRQSTRDTEWENGILPAHTSILIYAPFFHRDETRLSFAHTFHPQVWIDDDPEVQGNSPRIWPLVPFSGGPGVCPGRNLVLLLTSAMLASLIGERDIRMKEPQRMSPGRLPGTFNHFTLRFGIEGDIEDSTAMHAGRTATQPAREMVIEESGYEAGGPGVHG